MSNLVAHAALVLDVTRPCLDPTSPTLSPEVAQLTQPERHTTTLHLHHLYDLMLS